jgi:hypothetical protein
VRVRYDSLISQFSFFLLYKLILEYGQIVEYFALVAVFLVVGKKEFFLINLHV